MLDSIRELHQLKAHGQPAVFEWKESNYEHLYLCEEAEYDITLLFMYFINIYNCHLYFVYYKKSLKNLELIFYCQGINN